MVSSVAVGRTGQWEQLGAAGRQAAKRAEVVIGMVNSRGDSTLLRLELGKINKNVLAQSQSSAKDQWNLVNDDSRNC